MLCFEIVYSIILSLLFFGLTVYVFIFLGNKNNSKNVFGRDEIFLGLVPPRIEVSMFLEVNSPIVFILEAFGLIIIYLPF